MAPLTVRLATFEDAGMLWQWANDPVVRDSSFAPDPIPLEHHLRWLRAKLADEGTRMYILHDETGPAVQVRYDRISTTEAHIDISVAAPRRGRGLGAAALRATAPLALDALRVQRVVGIVREGNQASRAAFRSAGFEEDEPATVRGHRCAVYRWPPR